MRDNVWTTMCAVRRVKEDESAWNALWRCARGRMVWLPRSRPPQWTHTHTDIYTGRTVRTTWAWVDGRRPQDTLNPWKLRIVKDSISSILWTSLLCHTVIKLCMNTMIIMFFCSCLQKFGYWYRHTEFSRRTCSESTTSSSWFFNMAKFLVSVLFSVPLSRRFVGASFSLV